MTYMFWLPASGTCASCGLYVYRARGPTTSFWTDRVSVICLDFENPVGYIADMPPPNAALVERARLIAPLLRSIANVSELKTGAMCERLAGHMPSLEARSLQRNWNRWLKCAANDGPYPEVGTLIAVVQAAKAEGWLTARAKKPAGAHTLSDWLLVEASKPPRLRVLSASHKVSIFVDDLVGSPFVPNDELERLAPELLRAFARSLTRKIRERRDNQTQTISPKRTSSVSEAVDEDFVLVRRLLDLFMSRRDVA